MTLLMAQAETVCKELYTGQEITNLLLRKNPFLGRVKKRTDFYGKYMPIPLQYGHTTGGSATAATAFANVGPSSYAEFQLRRKKDYSFFRVETEAARASSNDKGAFAKLMDQEMTAAINMLERSLGMNIFRNGGGSRGRIGSGSGSQTLTLATSMDIYNFEQRMVIVSDDTDGTAGGAADAEPIPIGRITRNSGQLVKTTAGNWNANGNFAANDHLFREGDFSNMMHGLDAWIPPANPTPGESFNAVDRSVDEQRLAGHRYTATPSQDGTFSQAMINLSSVITLSGGAPDLVVVHPTVWARIVGEVENKTEFHKQARTKDGESADIGYTTIRCMGAAGPMDIMADKGCPRSTLWMLQEDTWELWSLGELAGWLDDDGNKMLRVNEEDELEGRFGSYHNLACDAPGWNGRMDISALLAA